MVTFTPNENGKTENANENVNGSRNLIFSSLPEFINLDNIPYFEVPPIPTFNQPAPRIPEHCIPVGNPPFGYYIPSGLNNNMNFSRNGNSRNVRIQQPPSRNLLGNNLNVNNQRQPFLDLTSSTQNVAAPLNYNNTHDRNLLARGANATISQVEDVFNAPIHYPVAPIRNDSQNTITSDGNYSMNLSTGINFCISPYTTNESLLTQSYHDHETQPQNNSAPTPQVNSDVSNIIDKCMQIEPPCELEIPDLDNLYPLSQINTDTNTNRTEINQFETVNYNVNDYKSLLANITAVLSATKNDEIEKQPSGVGLPKNDVTHLTSIEINADHGKLTKHVNQRHCVFLNEQGCGNLPTAMRKDSNLYTSPEYSNTNADASNKENREMQNFGATKLLQCNQNNIGTTLTEFNDISSMKFLKETQIMPPTKKVKITKQKTKQAAKTKPIQTKLTPKQKRRLAITSYKDDSDVSVSSNNNKIDQNVIGTAKTLNDAKLENAHQNIEMSENAQLENPRPNIQSSENMQLENPRPNIQIRENIQLEKPHPKIQQSTPNRKCKASVISYKEDSDDDAPSNDINMDQNVIEIAKTPNDATVETAPQNIPISANSHHTRTFQQVFVEFLQKRAQNNTWQ